MKIAAGEWGQIAAGYPIARLRLEAAIAASGEQLLNCQALLRHVRDGLEDEVSLHREGIESQVEAAMDELTLLLVAASGASSATASTDRADEAES